MQRTLPQIWLGIVKKNKNKQKQNKTKQKQNKTKTKNINKNKNKTKQKQKQKQKQNKKKHACGKIGMPVVILLKLQFLDFLIFFYRVVFIFHNVNVICAGVIYPKVPGYQMSGYPYCNIIVW